MYILVVQVATPLPKRPMKVPEPPLPMPFQVPSNYSPIVVEGLKAGSLTGKAMVKSEIADVLFSYKSYPTREEKDHVTRQCVKKLPFLEATCSTGYVSMPNRI